MAWGEVSCFLGPNSAQMSIFGVRNAITRGTWPPPRRAPDPTTRGIHYNLLYSPRGEVGRPFWWGPLTIFPQNLVSGHSSAQTMLEMHLALLLDQQKVHLCKKKLRDGPLKMDNLPTPDQGRLMMASLELGGVDLARGFYPLLTHLCYPLSNSAMHYSTLISTIQH